MEAPDYHSTPFDRTVMKRDQDSSTSASPDSRITMEVLVSYNVQFSTSYWIRFKMEQGVEVKQKEIKRLPIWWWATKINKNPPKDMTAPFLSPSQIIGSIVNTWPAFITPTALFSEIKEKKISKHSKTPVCTIQQLPGKSIHPTSHQWYLLPSSEQIPLSLSRSLSHKYCTDNHLGTLHSPYVFSGKKRCPWAGFQMWLPLL